ncbi:MAG: hypothetical protein AAGJ81_12545 [Verrucomicrobiota bacterium]
MTEAQTYSWIFYAASAAAQKEAVKIREIESVADAINHAVPTQKEISSSIRWLESKALIEREGKKVALTEEGKSFASEIAAKPSSTMKTWDRIAKAFQKMGADNSTGIDCRTMEAKQGSRGNVG